MLSRKLIFVCLNIDDEIVEEEKAKEECKKHQYQ